MKRKIPAVLALVITLAASSYLSATPVRPPCDDEVTALGQLLSMICGDEWHCSYNCSSGNLSDIVCECDE